VRVCTNAGLGKRCGFAPTPDWRKRFGFAQPPDWAKGADLHQRQTEQNDSGWTNAGPAKRFGFVQTPDWAKRSGCTNAGLAK
ncbi:hypothetical protein DIPPA_13262, partial [Diplonema papillatum]